MSRTYSPSTEALIAQFEDRMVEGRRFGVPTEPGSSAQDVRNWVDESDPETEQLKGLIRFHDQSIGYRREAYEERRRSILSWVAAVAILVGLTAIWMALPSRFHDGMPFLASVWHGTHVVAPLALVILLAIPYTRRQLTGFSLLLVLLGAWSLYSLFLAPMWWPTAIGGQEFGSLIMLVGFGLLIVAMLGGWAYNTWHNPREGLGIAAMMVALLAVMVLADWLEKRHGINWWLTAVPAFGALALVVSIMKRRPAP